MTTNNNTENIPNNTNAATSDDACGQLVLDRLLASLAIESDIMNRQSAKLSNGNCSPISYRIKHSRPNSNIFTYPTIITNHDANHNNNNNNNNNTQRQSLAETISNKTASDTSTAQSNGVHSNLNDVIANLTDFTRTETIRQLSLTGSNGNNSPGISNTNGRYSFEQAHMVVKRLASESENSSSISPSLSERSNGIVSWSDQV